MTRAMLALLALLGMSSCAGDPGARRADGTYPLIRVAEMPLDVRANMMFVRAKIDDEPVTLLVDTGAERTVLTEAAVDRLHLPRDLQHATRTIGIGSAIATWDARLPKGIVLGDTHFPVDSVSVGRFGIEQEDGGPADGLLGADILLAFDIDLDLPAQRITFYRARRECPEAAPPWNQPYVAVSGVSTRHNRLLVPFELDGVAGMAVLDSGAEFSSISQGTAERIGLTNAAMATDRTMMAQGAAPDQVPVHIHLFRAFRVGPAMMQTPELLVVPKVGGMADALVGADFLRGRRAWLSFSTQRIFVTPLETGLWIAMTRTADGLPPTN
jgi:predicted aspartyl protease